MAFLPWLKPWAPGLRSSEFTKFSLQGAPKHTPNTPIYLDYHY